MNQKGRRIRKRKAEEKVGHRTETRARETKKKRQKRTKIIGKEKVQT